MQEKTELINNLFEIGWILMIYLSIGWLNTVE